MSQILASRIEAEVGDSDRGGEIERDREITRERDRESSLPHESRLR
jgi:hypothetical protein